MQTLIQETHRFIHNSCKTLSFPVFAARYGWELGHLVSKILGFLDSGSQMPCMDVRCRDGMSGKSNLLDIASDQII